MNTQRQIRSVLIANRGEIAVRIMRTCRELGIRAIAVYSDADRTKPHVLMADHAVRLGPAPSRESYLRMDALIAAAHAAGADAVHPGYGFLSENAAFASLVREEGLIWIGPPAEAIRAMGDKTAARALMQRAGVPTVPGTDGPVDSVDQAEAFCATAGFPVLIKAAAGGGGKGMRIVRSVAELPHQIDHARSEARSAFGDDRVYIERYLEEPRHIEFQILADAFGTIVHLGERECSIQRRHQKVVEESPSVLLTPELREEMGATAVRAAGACGYVNAGTIEFLVDRHRQFYFLEMNTRLQVEHPVTELRTGLDLVREQIRIAGGEPLGRTQADIRFTGHAIECRVCAEDPANGFLPSTGRITRLRAPGGPGIREDRGFGEGDEIPVHYDSLLAKIIAWGADREMAIERMRRALAEYVVEGVMTNIPVCDHVMRHPQFRSGRYDTGFLAQWEGNAPAEPDEPTLTAVAVLSAWLAHAKETAGPFSAPVPGAAAAPENGRSAWKDRRLASMRGGNS